MRKLMITLLLLPLFALAQTTEDLIIENVMLTVNPEKIKVGDIGKSIGRLAPSGKVKVNGEVVEAQSTGSFVNQNTEIKVLKILTNKIIVEPVKKE